MSRRDSLTERLGLPVIREVVAGQIVQDEDLAPLSALIQGCEQLVDGGSVHLYTGIICAAGLIYFCHSSNSIGHNHGVGVTEHLLQTVKEECL
jgi:hypothetical protein